MPRLKRFISEVKAGVVPQTLWLHKDVGHTQDAKRELLAVLDFQKSEDVFATLKPTGLIERMLEIATDKDSIVLDAFAGSGSTAQAVLQMNQREAGSRRRFIWVESEDYADSLTAERLRRVIKGVPKAKDEILQKGLGGSFSFIEIGNAMHLESLLKGDKLPAYEDLASHVFYTATGEEFNARVIQRKTNFIGESTRYEVYRIRVTNPVWAGVRAVG